MNNMPADTNRRVLVIDDNTAIHDDFRKILSAPHRRGPGRHRGGGIWGAPETGRQTRFEVDSAYQGPEGVLMVTKALRPGGLTPWRLWTCECRRAGTASKRRASLGG